MSLLVCGSCGADLQRRSECTICRDPRLLRDLGIQRRRAVAAPWLALVVLLGASIAGWPTQQSNIDTPGIQVDAPTGHVDVTARPGQAAHVEYIGDETVASAPQRSEPSGEARTLVIAWHQLIPPLAAWSACAARLLAVALSPRPVTMGVAHSAAAGTQARSS